MLGFGCGFVPPGKAPSLGRPAIHIHEEHCKAISGVICTQSSFSRVDERSWTGDGL